MPLSEVTFRWKVLMPNLCCDNVTCASQNGAEYDLPGCAQQLSELPGQALSPCGALFTHLGREASGVCAARQW